VDLKELTAPCGLACFACPVYKDNITDELAQQTAEMFGMNPKDVACEGCRSENGPSFMKVMGIESGCPVKKCADSKGLHNCSECSVFPCEKLMPVADKSDMFPHNTKLYNLCRIKLLGLEKWAGECGQIQNIYFNGRFDLENGPFPEEDTEQSK